MVAKITEMDSLDFFSAAKLFTDIQNGSLFCMNLAIIGLVILRRQRCFKLKIMSDKSKQPEERQDFPPKFFEIIHSEIYFCLKKCFYTEGLFFQGEISFSFIFQYLAQSGIENLEKLFWPKAAMKTR